jgi:hypothetical protein
VAWFLIHVDRPVIVADKVRIPITGLGKRAKPFHVSGIDRDGEDLLRIRRMELRTKEIRVLRCPNANRWDATVASIKLALLTGGHVAQANRPGIPPGGFNWGRVSDLSAVGRPPGV